MRISFSKIATIFFFGSVGGYILVFVLKINWILANFILLAVLLTYLMFKKRSENNRSKH